MRSVIVAAVMATGMVTAAQADIITSAPAYGGTTSQSVAVCYYSNLGSTGITYNSSQIFVEPGNALPEVSEFCTSEPGNSSCRTVAQGIPNNLAIWCRANVSDKRNVRPVPRG